MNKEEAKKLILSVVDGIKLTKEERDMLYSAVTILEGISQENNAETGSDR